METRRAGRTPFYPLLPFVPQKRFLVDGVCLLTTTTLRAGAFTGFFVHSFLVLALDSF